MTDGMHHAISQPAPADTWNTAVEVLREQLAANRGCTSSRALRLALEGRGVPNARQASRQFGSGLLARLGYRTQAHETVGRSAGRLHSDGECRRQAVGWRLEVGEI